MKEQIYVLEQVKSFEPRHIFECGQCFRWNKEDDESYTGVFGKTVLNVKKIGTKVIFTGISNEKLEQVCNKYFDFDTNYEEIKQKLSDIDEHLEKSITYGEGIRILHQDLWETIISFIISANNNIPRIKGIVERISAKYGDEIIWNNKKYYTFPTVEQLGKATVEELRGLGLGFRDKRVYDTTRIFLNGEMTLKQLENEKDINRLRDRLLELPGVGPKVADCIMLFSLKKYEVFPIDVWVRRVMNDLYIHNEEEEKVSKKELQYLAKEKYSDLAGLAQQYLFYWKREA